MDRLVAEAAPRTTVAILAVRVEDGLVLAESQADLLLHPASTAKLLTTAALCAAGLEDAECRTRLRGDPARGLLVLEGGGDPFLSTSDLALLASRAAPLLASRPIQELIHDGRIFEGPDQGPGWMWDDAIEPFQAPVQGLLVDEGCLRLEVARKEAGVELRVEPPLPFVDVEARTPASPEGPRLAATRSSTPGRDAYQVTVRLEAGERAELRVTTGNPGLAAAWRLRQALESLGVAFSPGARILDAEAVPGGLPADLQELAVFRRSWRSILPRLNKESHNLAAECALRHLDAGPGPRRAEAGLAALRGFLARAGVPGSAYVLVDGSGLSHYNLVSARCLVQVLCHMRGLSNAGRLWRESLAIGGVDGTLARRIRDPRVSGQVRAKTGSLRGVSTIAGYLDAGPCGEVAFAILVQNFSGSAGPWRDLQDRILVALLDLAEEAGPVPGGGTR
jgi:D-alanyl-D-alanine carboxypeptidase/D-alanyl-D-alanine-endopeptidase (penicillin-binding protein 4)